MCVPKRPSTDKILPCIRPFTFKLYLQFKHLEKKFSHLAKYKNFRIMRLHNFIMFSCIAWLLQLSFFSLSVQSEIAVSESSNNHNPLDSPISSSLPNSAEIESTESTTTVLSDIGTDHEPTTNEDWGSNENAANLPQPPLVNTMDAEQMYQLIASNVALTSRIGLLEGKVARLEGLLGSIRQEVHFHHPTMEVQFVDMQVVQWSEALKNGLRKMAIQFQAGYSLGAISTWEFSLANESDALTVNLLLIDEKYGKEALFAGFTAYILDTEGNLYSQANALPVNFLDGNGRNLHLPNVISLNDILDSNNGLLSDEDVFKIRFRLELVGVGHKLYSETPLNEAVPLTKDTQTVVFDVDDVFAKLEQNRDNNSGGQKSPLAYTRFRLKHDTWHMETSWSAELHKTGGDDPEEGALSLYIILEKCPWPELYASFHVEVWDFLNKRIIQTQGTPINNFAKDRITIDPLLLLSQLKEMHDEDDLVSLRFKLQFVVYGRNARYYSDVV